MDKEDTDLKTELSGLETKQLRKRAREGGMSAKALEEALKYDESNEKKAYIDFLIEENKRPGVNILESIYKRLGKEYPTDNIEDEKKLARILLVNRTIDITNVPIIENVDKITEYLVNEYMIGRGKLCSKYRIDLKKTNTTKAILEELQRVKDGDGDGDDTGFVDYYIDKMDSEVMSEEFGGGGNSKKRKSKKRKSNRRKSKRRKSKRRKTRRKKR